MAHPEEYSGKSGTVMTYRSIARWQELAEIIPFDTISKAAVWLSLSSDEA